ncbi:MAG: VanZ family protein [Sedimentisphaerales bacterium]|nr:VanZ family protein [Sedimentisphaerales bacterium]
MIVVSVVTLLFGLWPLDFLCENHVRWLVGQNGIQFYTQSLTTQRYTGGVIYSDSPVEPRTGSPAFVPSTIEIHLESHGQSDRGLMHIASFHDGYPRSPLVIAQWKTELGIRSRDNRNPALDSYRETGLHDGLNLNEKKLITIASGPERTDIYVNGELARSCNVASLIGAGHFRGYLNVGNSSIGHNAWIGNLYGLALYDTLLTPEQIRQHYELWADGSADQLAAATPEPVLLYTFAERSGALVHNQMDDANHLIIPSRFKPLRKPIVVRFWHDIEWDKAAVKDVLVNIFGFIPFALCLLLFLTANTRMSARQAALLTVPACAILSLLIEVTQIALPTRSPSSLDLLCNTAGAVLGVLVFRMIRILINSRAACHPERSAAK